MGLLGDIFSTLDSGKRKVKGLLSDPLGELGLLGTRLYEDTQNMNQLAAMAYPMAKIDPRPSLDTPQGREGYVAQNAARNKLAELAANMGMSAATVWHGSPHKFNKFDSSKIGTGEGAQAYGHGLYLAESPDVAKAYRQQLASTDFTYADEAAKTAMKQATNFDDHVWGVIDRFAKENSADPKATAAAIRKYADRYSSGRSALQSAADLMDAGRMAPTEAGALYKVDLPDDAIAKMLDWDLPLSQQAPEVQAAVAKFKAATIPESGLDMGGGRIFANHEGQVKPNSSSPYVLKAGDALFDISQRDIERMLMSDKGEAAYTRMTSLLGGQGQASQALRQAGIPGIRYLDGGSRGAGTGTRNYVVFPGNEGLLTILERNGVKP